MRAGGQAGPLAWVHGCCRQRRHRTVSGNRPEHRRQPHENTRQHHLRPTRPQVRHRSRGTTNHTTGSTHLQEQATLVTFCSLAEASRDRLEVAPRRALQLLRGFKCRRCCAINLQLHVCRASHRNSDDTRTGSQSTPPPHSCRTVRLPRVRGLGHSRDRVALRIQRKPATARGTKPAEVGGSLGRAGGTNVRSFEGVTGRLGRRHSSAALFSCLQLFLLHDLRQSQEHLFQRRHWHTQAHMSECTLR